MSRHIVTSSAASHAANHPLGSNVPGDVNPRTHSESGGATPTHEPSQPNSISHVPALLLDSFSVPSMLDATKLYKVK